MGLQRILDILASEDIELDPLLLADSLWLASKLSPHSIPQSEPQPRESSSQSSNKGSLGSKNLFNTSTSSRKEPSSRTKENSDIHALSTELNVGRIKGHKIAIPNAPLISNALAYERILRNITKKRKSKHLWEFDEEATVDFIASTKVWNIFQRPRQERWLDGILLFEHSPTMRIWQDILNEFRGLLWRTGAFRLLKTYHIDSYGHEPKLKHNINDSQVLPATSILDSLSSNKVIFLFTDSLSNAWLRGQIPQLIETWKKHFVVCIIQVLPKNHWDRTSLRNCKFIPSASRSPISYPLPQKKSSSSYSQSKLVPVFSFDAQGLRSLSSFLTATPKNKTIAYSNSFEDFIEIENNVPDVDDKALANREATSIFSQFMEYASPITLNLAKYLAISPLFLPVIRLIQYRLAPKSRYSHIAEIFNSGIVFRRDTTATHTTQDHIEYDFIPGAREALLAQGGIPRTQKVWETLSLYLEDRFGVGSAFNSILQDPLSIKEFSSSSHAQSLEPFIRTSKLVLRQLAHASVFSSSVNEAILSSYYKGKDIAAGVKAPSDFKDEPEEVDNNNDIQTSPNNTLYLSDFTQHVDISILIEPSRKYPDKFFVILNGNFSGYLSIQRDQVNWLYNYLLESAQALTQALSKNQEDFSLVIDELLNQETGLVHRGARAFNMIFGSGDTGTLLLSQISELINDGITPIIEIISSDLMIPWDLLYVNSLIPSPLEDRGNVHNDRDTFIDIMKPFLGFSTITSRLPGFSTNYESVPNRHDIDPDNKPILSLITDQSLISLEKSHSMFHDLEAEGSLTLHQGTYEASRSTQDLDNLFSKEANIIHLEAPIADSFTGATFSDSVNTSPSLIFFNSYSTSLSYSGQPDDFLTQLWKTRASEIIALNIEVEDLPTADFVKSFYKYFVEDKYNLGESFFYAKMEFLHESTTPIGVLPLFYGLYGNSGLRLQAN